MADDNVVSLEKAIRDRSRRNSHYLVTGHWPHGRPCRECPRIHKATGKEIPEAPQDNTGDAA